MTRWLRNVDQRLRYGVKSNCWLEVQRKNGKLPPPCFPFGKFPMNTEQELDLWDGMDDAQRAEYLLTVADRWEAARAKLPVGTKKPKASEATEITQESI